MWATEGIASRSAQVSVTSLSTSPCTRSCHWSVVIRGTTKAVSIR